MPKVLWTQKQDVGPSGRGSHAIAYDSGRQRVVLFGGSASGGTLRADTWQWDGADWTQVADTGPDARRGHALAYDADRNRTVLFGGEAAGPTLRADTWEWDGADWTQVADTGPDTRSGHALAYDADRNRTVLFGGEAAGPTLRADTWEWDGNEWTQVADMGPSPSSAPAMTFGQGRTLLFGGVTSPATPVAAEMLSRLSWEWDGALWTLRQDMGPAARWGHALAFDSARGRPVLFGGFSALPDDPDVADSVLADTWEASLEAIPEPGPEPGAAPALVSFTLDPDTVVVSGITGGPEPPCTFEVGLDGPAPAGGVQVDILSAGPGGGTPMFPIFVGEGSTTGSVTVSIPAEVTPGNYEFVAQFGTAVIPATLQVVLGP